MIAGFNNWDRIHRYRQAWEAGNFEANPQLWAEEFRRLLNNRPLYQDRFLILSEGAYSGVTAVQLNLSTDEWSGLSNQIRLYHEMTHYLTKRVYGEMHTHLLDEVIADYAGIVATVGTYRPDWFLHFMGLEGNTYRQGGRLQNYCPDLSTDAFTAICEMTRHIAQNLADFDKAHSHVPLVERILTLTQCTLPEMAKPDASQTLGELLKRITR